MTTLSHRVGLTKIGIFFFFTLLRPFTRLSLDNDDRRNHEGLSRPEFKSSNEKPLWRSTKVSAPSFQGSFPKCPFVSQVLKPTRTFWPTRKLGRRPWATYSSVRFTSCRHPFLAVRVINFHSFGANSWVGRWNHGGRCRCMSDGGCEDPVTGTDALPR